MTPERSDHLEVVMKFHVREQILKVVPLKLI